MNLETLKQFCSRDTTRTGILEPWSVNGHSFATDGHILLRVPRLDQVVENKNAPKTDQLFADSLHTGNFLSIPDLPEPRDGPCPECKGSGKVPAECQKCDGEGTTLCPRCEDGQLECDKCDGTGVLEEQSEIPCEDCDGSGKRPVLQRVAVGNQTVDVKFLRLIKDLPNVRIANGQEEVGALTFVFDGGDGLIMPIRT